MEWLCPWIQKCVDSPFKGGSAFVQVCLGFNLAHAGWRTYRLQCKELFESQRAESADITTDLLDSVNDQNRLTRGVIKIYVWSVGLFDIFQRFVLWATYIGAVFAILLSLWMLFFNEFSKHGWLLLLPPVLLPVFFLVARWLITYTAKGVQLLLGLPSASKLAEEIREMPDESDD